MSLTPSQKKLLKTWWKKVMTNGIQLKQTGVFDVPLIESIRYAYTKISFNNQQKECYGLVPIVIAKCGSYLKQEALYEEGIFRISGNSKRLSLLQSIFDRAEEDYGLNIDWTGYSVHDAANLMSRYLNRLPQPIIILEYQNSFKNILDLDFPNLSSKIDGFQKLIEKLPTVHQYVLLYILDILYLFSLYYQHTRMDISSLATTFTPALFSDPNDALNPASYKKSQQVLEFLIQYQEHFSMPILNNLDSSSSKDDLFHLPPNLKRSNTTPSRRDSKATSKS
ncbi:hypothetical protein G6F42_009073 [Rhizopus arrhizus]|nr:hypothetical protein G6F42_009073 [Rhizopus arrhizus]